MNVIPISGKDSLAAALVQTVHEPQEYRFFFTDTGAELPETYAWLDSVEAKTGWRIERVGESLPGLIEKNRILPSARMRFCTTHGKIKPMERWLGEGEHTVYFGIRADEQRVGYKPTSKKCVITPRYPLHEHGIGLGAVYAILEAKDLLPPSFHWQALEDRVDELWQDGGYLFGDWRQFLSFHERRVLFAGRSRSNCYFCFYQRRYEFCWLADTHPDLFARAVEIEESTGAEGYTWIEDLPLREIAANRDHYLNRRANEVVKYIAQRAYEQATHLEVDNSLAHTSCGLFCGK